MKTILCIEDHPAHLKLIREILSRAGYRVLGALTAEEGMLLARLELPELILMDVQLPGLDGLSATRRLKADPLTAHIPVVAITACAMYGDEARSLAAGCDRYLAKPVRYVEVLEAVRELIGAPQAQLSVRCA